MNPRSALSLSAVDTLSHSAPPPELTRFADAVTTEGKSLLVVRSTSEALNTLSEQLQALWHARAPQLKMEHFSGRHSAGLLGLVNTTLAEQPLHHSMQAEDPAPLSSVCVVHDAECLTTPQLLLLQRLIDGFPSWGMAWVFLFKNTTDTAIRLSAVLEAPSKALMVWQIHNPMAPSNIELPPKRVNLWSAGLVGLAGLAVLGTAAVQLSPPAGMRTPSAWLAQLVGAPPAQTTPPAPPAPPAPSASTSPQSPVATAGPAGTSALSQPVESGVAARPAPTGPAGVDQAAAPAPVAPPPVAPAPPVATAPNSKAPDTADASAQLPPVPDVAQRGHRWLAGMSKDFYIILHGSHASLALAKRQIDSRPELNTARVIMTKATSSENSRFWVVTGPFRSKDRAENHMVRQNLPVSALVLEAGEVLERSRSTPKGTGKDKAG